MIIRSFFKLFYRCLCVMLLLPSKYKPNHISDKHEIVLVKKWVYLQFIFWFSERFIYVFIIEERIQYFHQKGYLPNCNSPRIVNKEVRLTIQICNKECQSDVNGKEDIDNIINDQQCILLGRQKGELKRANPGRVNDQNYQQHLPSPVKNSA